jgi:hypothetical protein
MNTPIVRLHNFGVTWLHHSQGGSGTIVTKMVFANVRKRLINVKIKRVN